MDKQEIVEKIKKMKEEEGLTCKGLSKRFNLSEMDIYHYISRKTPCKRIHAVLEEYFKEEK